MKNIFLVKLYLPLGGYNVRVEEYIRNHVVILLDFLGHNHGILKL